MSDPKRDHIELRNAQRAGEAIGGIVGLLTPDIGELFVPFHHPKVEQLINRRIFDDEDGMEPDDENTSDDEIADEPAQSSSIPAKEILAKFALTNAEMTVPVARGIIAGLILASRANQKRQARIYQFHQKQKAKKARAERDPSVQEVQEFTR